ncbi:MAG: hypothetical protein U9P49_04715, partial [Thermodesulfobacteriota bacterium]|nr:hypothetical protein [Thermodesulfobacteriota bacterium]
MANPLVIDLSGIASLKPAMNIKAIVQSSQKNQLNLVVIVKPIFSIFFDSRLLTLDSRLFLFTQNPKLNTQNSKLLLLFTVYYSLNFE